MERPPRLDVSALSPDEYDAFRGWLAELLRVPPGAALDSVAAAPAVKVPTQDVVGWLRTRCGVEYEHEVKILSQFDNFSKGFAVGEVYAILRLVAWVQAGRTPSRSLIFTQTQPARTSDAPPPSQPLPPPTRRVSVKVAQPQPLSGHHHHALSSPEVSPAHPTRSVQPIPQTVVQPPSTPAAHSSPAPAGGANPFLQSPAQLDKPAASADSGNPFQEPSRSATTQPSKTPRTTAAKAGPGGSNPFRHVSSPAAPPPLADDASGSSVATRSPGPPSNNAHQPSNPPLPPRPRDKEGLKPPPPLPPRHHISPLIQASLAAASEVRRKEESKPPKTYNVIARSDDLTRQALQVPSSSRDVDVTRRGDAKKKAISSKFVSSAHVGPITRRKGASGNPLSPAPGDPSTTVDGRRASSDNFAASAAAVAYRPTAITARPRSPSAPTGSGPVAGSTLPRNATLSSPPTIAPKPSYVGKGKAPIPAWLQEQEEITLAQVGMDPAGSSNTSATARPPPPPSATKPRYGATENPFESGGSSSGGSGTPTLARASSPPPPADYRENLRPLGRSKTLHHKTTPPPPPRRRIDSIGAASSPSSSSVASPNAQAQSYVAHLPSLKAQMNNGPNAHHPSSASTVGSSPTLSTTPSMNEPIYPHGSSHPFPSVHPGGGSGQKRHSSGLSTLLFGSNTRSSSGSDSPSPPPTTTTITSSSHAAPGDSPMDHLSKDIANLVDRHGPGWLARASAGVTGKGRRKYERGERRGLVGDVGGLEDEMSAEEEVSGGERERNGLGDGRRKQAGTGTGTGPGPGMRVVSEVGKRISSVSFTDTVVREPTRRVRASMDVVGVRAHGGGGGGGPDVDDWGAAAGAEGGRGGGGGGSDDELERQRERLRKRAEVADVNDAERSGWARLD